MPLPAGILPRLDPLIRRLATDHDGECIATVRALERVLATTGADFHDLAAALNEPPIIVERPTARRPSPGRATWNDLRGMASELDGHQDLSPWEDSFVANVRRTLRRGFPLSAEQCRTLERIWLRVGEGAAA